MTVTIAGEGVTKHIGEMSLSTDEDTAGEELSFSCFKLYDCGTHIVIEDGGEIRYVGVIVAVEEGSLPPFNYRALDFSMNLKGDEIIQFRSVRVDDALQDLCRRIQVPNEICYIPVEISGIYKDSTINIIKKLLEKAAAETGAFYFYEVRGACFYVERFGRLKVKPSCLISDDGTINRTAEEVANSIIAADNNNTILAERTSERSEAIFGTLKKVVDVEEKTTIAKAGIIAGNELKNLNRIKATKSVEFIATSDVWDIRKNRLIYLNSGKLNGWYEINSVTHTIETSGVHRFSLEVSWYEQIE